MTNHVGAVLHLQSLQWTDLTLHGVLGHKPDGRQHHASAVVPGGIIVHGGFNGIQHLGDTWLLDPATYTWRQLHKPDPAPACSNHCLVLLEGACLLRVGAEASSRASTVLAPPVVQRRWLVDPPPPPCRSLKASQRLLRGMDDGR